MQKRSDICGSGGKETFLVPFAYAASTVALLSSSPSHHTHFQCRVNSCQKGQYHLYRRRRRHIHLKSEVMVSQTPNQYEDFRMQ